MRAEWEDHDLPRPGPGRAADLPLDHEPGRARGIRDPSQANRQARQLVGHRGHAAAELQGVEERVLTRDRVGGVDDQDRVVERHGGLEVEASRLKVGQQVYLARLQPGLRDEGSGPDDRLGEVGTGRGGLDVVQQLRQLGGCALGRRRPRLTGTNQPRPVLGAGPLEACPSSGLQSVQGPNLTLDPTRAHGIVQDDHERSGLVDTALSSQERS